MKISVIKIGTAILPLLVLILSSCNSNSKTPDYNTARQNQLLEVSCFYNSMALQMFADAYRLGVDKQKIHKMVTFLRDRISENNHIRKINSNAYRELFDNRVTDSLAFGTKYYNQCAGKYILLDKEVVRKCMGVSYIQRISYIAKRKGVSKNKFMSTLINQTGYTNTRGLKNISQIIGLIYEAPSSRSAIRRMYVTFDLCRKRI